MFSCFLLLGSNICSGIVLCTLNVSTCSLQGLTQKRHYNELVASVLQKMLQKPKYKSL